MKIARVFPRKTKATPDDDLVYFGYPREGEIPDVDEVHISVTFTPDLPLAESLANEWVKTGIPTKIGGPALKEPAGDFTPGIYMKEGYTITSRGCNNDCWFCDVPNTQRHFIELPIKDGWIVQDDNLLAASENHIKSVFDMLKRQPQKAELRSLEAKLLKPWHVQLIQEVKPQTMYFAYDTPDDYEPLVKAGRLLKEAGYTVRKRKSYCYVLMGYPGDTFSKAEKRCKEALAAGFIPYAMLHMDKSGFQDPTWGKFQRLWLRPAIIASHSKEYFVA